MSCFHWAVAESIEYLVQDGDEVGEERSELAERVGRQLEDAGMDQVVDELAAVLPQQLLGKLCTSDILRTVVMLYTVTHHSQGRECHLCRVAGNTV